MATLKTTLQIKRDTAARWAYDVTDGIGARYIPKAGEPCYETDTQKLKIGDGLKMYKELDYIGGSIASHYEYTRELNESGAYDLTEEQAITEALKDAEGNNIEAVAGDTLVIKTEIADGKYSHTAYVYDVDADADTGVWKAMDGNYSADNVYLTNGITLAGSYTSVGNVQLSSGTLGSAGTSISDLLTSIFTKELDPTIAVPAITLSTTGATSNTEVGSTYAMPTATLKISNIGTYSYGSANKDENGNLINKTTNTSAGVPFTKASITNDKTTDTISFETTTENTDVLTLNETIKLTTTKDNLSTESMKDLIIKDSSVTYKFTGKATYPAFGSYPESIDEKYPLTNLKNEFTGSNTNYNTIKAGKELSSTANVTISGFRNYWYGFINTTDYKKIVRNADNSVSVTNESGVIKTLKAGGKAIANGTFQVQASTGTAGTLESSASVLTSVDGDKAFVIVVPAAADKTVTSACLPLSLNAPIDFTKHANALNIAGLNGYKSGTDGAYGDKDKYDVLIYAPASMPAGTEVSITLGTDTTN